MSASAQTRYFRLIAYAHWPRFDGGGMPELTRKLINDHPQNWAINYASVRVGAISERVGNPAGTDRWKWHCGFYPGSHPRKHRDGTAPTFDAARAAFEAAWRNYLPLRTEADFEEWRRHAAFTAEKYAEWDRGKRMPPGG